LVDCIVLARRDQLKLTEEAEQHYPVEHRSVYGDIVGLDLTHENWIEWMLEERDDARIRRARLLLLWGGGFCLTERIDARFPEAKHHDPTIF
jgi:hypothetical protein